MNGLSFAGKIPLVGVDGLDAMLDEYENQTRSFSVALLNAFNNDVYFAIKENGIISQKGCKNIDLLCAELKSNYAQEKIRFIGNGASLYSKILHSYFENNSEQETNIPQYCSVDKIGSLAFEKWGKKENISHQLMPLYLKQVIVSA